MVEGSPVKDGRDAKEAAGGDANDDQVEDGDMSGVRDERNGDKAMMNGAVVEDVPMTPPAADLQQRPQGQGLMGPPPPPDSEWRRDASRPASMASQFLSRTLAVLPITPPAPTLCARDDASESPSSASSGRTLRSSTIASRESGVVGKGAHVGTGRGEKGKSKSAGSGSLKVLRDCTIFVDVRTDDGDDAGGLFVDMLQGLGAKVRVRFACLWVVYCLTGEMRRCRRSSGWARRARMSCSRTG